MEVRMSIKKAATPRQDRNGRQDLGPKAEDLRPKAEEQRATDAALDEALEDSFPASDPPQQP